ncbi:hypothetical protein K7X08_030975 [Anisodus acutangulus]|uniref:Uncharacterized protein n=1 Tax=Anisodus acutangulus TaxID=402998 RepID=A0A9Q1RNE6_9SOLA|nr:hypothetical protein K7X08_030975 [Anisodus acutangulus]
MGLHRSLSYACCKAKMIMTQHRYGRSTGYFDVYFYCSEVPSILQPTYSLRCVITLQNSKHLKIRNYIHKLLSDRRSSLSYEEYIMYIFLEVGINLERLGRLFEVHDFCLVFTCILCRHTRKRLQEGNLIARGENFISQMNLIDVELPDLCLTIPGDKIAEDSHEEMSDRSMREHQSTKETCFLEEHVEQHDSPMLDRKPELERTKEEATRKVSRSLQCKTKHSTNKSL